jgi:hypothetical protein
LLIYSNPGVKRAFGDSPKANQAAKLPGRAKLAAKRAEREKFSPLNLLHHS